MKLYLVIGLAGLVLVAFLDKILGTKLLRNKNFWILQIIVFFLASLVDNYISGRPIVFFNSEEILGLKVVYVPLENFIFGFDMVALNVILFEYFKKKK